MKRFGECIVKHEVGTDMWNITNKRDDGIGAGCFSAVFALFSVGILLLWLCRMIRLESLVSIVLLFSVPGILCSLCSRLLEEQEFAKIGFYVCLTVLLVVMMMAVSYTFSGYEWKFVRYRGMWF